MYMRLHFIEIERQQKYLEKLVEHFLDNFKPEGQNLVHHAQIIYENNLFCKLTHHHTFEKIYKNFKVFVYEVKINSCQLDIKLI